MSKEKLHSLLKQIGGTLPLEACEELYELALSARGGAFVDIGSFQGRLAVTLAMASRDGWRSPVYAIDPNERFTGIMGGSFGPQDRWRLTKNLQAERIIEQIHLINQTAYQAVLGWNQSVSLLVLDADFRHWALRRDAMIWMPWVPVGGHLLVGGAGNKKNGTLPVVRELVERFGFKTKSRIGTLVVLERERQVGLPDPKPTPWRWPFPGQVKRAEALFNEAYEAQRAGDTEKAEKRYEQTLVMNPLHAQALNNFGVMLKQQARFPEAENLQRAAVLIRPTEPSFIHNLANTLTAAEEPELALAFFDKLVGLSPKKVGGWLGLADCLKNCHRYEDAHCALDRAGDLDPEAFEVMTARAGLLAAENRPEEARELFEKIVERWPGNVNAVMNLANHLRQNGYVDRAKELLNHVISAKPDLVQAYVAAADLKKFLRGHPWFSRLERWREDTSVPRQQRVGLEFSLARMYSTTKDYDKAFDAYQRGNDLRNELAAARGHQYQPAQARATSERARGFFTKAFFDRIKEQGLFGSDSDVPVFVFGMPRSGTTLTESLIAKHPQGGGAGEMEDMGKLVQEYVRTVGLCEGQGFPFNLELMTKEIAEQLANKYLRQMRELSTKPDAKRIVDKMPGNYQWLGFMWLLFPNATFIDARRDPADNCLSCFMQNFAQRHEYTNRLDHLALQYNNYLRLIEHYHKVFPKPILRWQYEDVVSDQETQVKRLLEFVGLDWDEQVLRFYEDKRTVRTASVLQVRKPIYTSSSGRWKRYEAHLGPLLEGLGYVDGVYKGLSVIEEEALTESEKLMKKMTDAGEPRKEDGLARAD